MFQEIIKKFKSDYHSTIFRNNSFLFILGCFFLFFLILFSVIFYKERLFQSDNAFYAFKMVQINGFEIENRRYINALSQLIPLIALKFNLPLKWVFILYSSSFYLIFIFSFLILTQKLKDYRSAFILLLSTVLTIRNIFYLPVAELYQGFGLVLILWSYLNRSKIPDMFKISWIFLPIFLFAISIFIHPLLLLLLFFVLALFTIKERIYLNKNIVTVGLIFLSISLLEYLLIKNSGYEQGRVVPQSEIISRIYSIWKLPITIDILLFIKSLWPFLLVVISMFVYLLYKKRFLTLFFIISFASFYIVLCCISAPLHDSPFVYENYMSALSIFILLGLYDIRMNRIFSIIIICSLFITSFYYIFCSHYTLSKRIEYIERLNDYGTQKPEKKYIISTANLPWRYVWTSWHLPFESILVQYVKDPENLVSFFCTDHMNQYDSLLADSTIFLGPEWDYYMFNWPQNKLKKKYFRFPNLSYLKLNTSQDNPSFDESNFNRNNISLTTQFNDYYFDTDSFQIIPVRIINNSRHTLASIRGEINNIALTYHLYNNEGKLISWDQIRTPLDIDVDNEFTQGLYISKPAEKGKYKIVIDFVTEGKRWWGLDLVIYLSNN